MELIVCLLYLAQYCFPQQNKYVLFTLEYCHGEICHIHMMCNVGKDSLTLRMLNKQFNRRHFEILFLICHFSPENKETICMKCQNLFSEKSKQKYRQFVVCCISPE